jgi:GNAT superfamily N-acetyltransferase
MPEVQRGESRGVRDLLGLQGTVAGAMSAIRIRRLEKLGLREIDGLCDVLIDCVEGGASVSFMQPMTRDKALGFWKKVAAGVENGERIVLIAEDHDGSIIGTSQVVNAESENQPHRADIAKMLVHRRARKRGIGALLLKAAEEAALRAGKTLLVLDTASADAERLYERNGWQRVGGIPNYALLPDGPPCATIVYFKQLAE